MRNQMKETIADAFIALAQKKSIDKITVKDLVDYCDISRQSFYYHFQDILEVIEWHMQQTEKDISVRCREAGDLEAAVKIMVQAYVDHYTLFEKLRDSQKRNFVEQLVMDSLENHFRQAAREIAVDRPLDMKASEAETLIRFFAFGLAGLILSSYRRNKTPDVDELSDQILVVFKRFTPGLKNQH